MTDARHNDASPQNFSVKILCYAGLRNSRSAGFLNILINAEIRNLYKRDL